MSEKFVVVVTHGVRQNVPYATVPSYESARKLVRAAIERGYLDARVEHETDFRAAQEAHRRGAASPAGAAA